MKRTIGIDYGKKRVGIAVTDPEQIITYPLATIPTPEVIPFLKKYISENENIVDIVVGNPTFEKLTENSILGEVKNFIANLHKYFPDIKIYIYDERFTSRLAAIYILQSGVKKMKRQEKGLKDKISASLILESFLKHPNKEKFQIYK